LPRRSFLAALAAGSAALVAPAATRAEDQDAAIASPQPIVAPLQPVPIVVRLAGYSGPAALVLFDAAGRYAGVAEGQIENGQGTIDVVPRGAIGPQWAALFASGQQVAANPALFTLDARTGIVTGQERFDAFIPAAQRLMAEAVLAYQLGDTPIRGYRSPDSGLIWLRDHVYQQRGFRYFDGDIRQTLDRFRDIQYGDGSLPEILPRPGHTDAPIRTPVEADVEYLYVQGVFEAWQATGDDDWLRSHLGAMRRALTYTLQSPLRWDAERGLVKRPFTIDTWDFEVGPTTANPATGEPSPRHWIDERTVWGVFHGDNTGMAQALTMMARVEDRVGDGGFAQLWRAIAPGIVGNLASLAWNGRFFTHHVAYQPVEIPGLNLDEQLSLSNALALNRGVLTPEQCAAILGEYARRGASDTARYASGRPDGSFAEWYSIDPPFPYGAVGLAGRTGELPGTYVNGGIMPLVGGELARGALRNGLEAYGFAMLELYWLKMLSRGRTFLWYRRDGAEGVGSDETIPFDGWGTAAMLTALLEGAAGVEDNAVAFYDATVSPRWTATRDVRAAYVVSRYAASGGYVAYRWAWGERAISVEVTGSPNRVVLRVLLPPEAGAGKKSRGLRATLNGAAVALSVEERGSSRYAVVEAPGTVVQVQISW
jgi:hypothetical protein